MWDSAVITNAGKSLLAQWLSGVVLNFDSAATGEGIVADAYLMAQTELTAQKQALSIVGSEKTESGIQLQLQCTSEGVTSPYVINQIGVWASLDGGASVLTAIFQDATGVSVPSYEEMPDYVFTFYAVLQISNTGEFTVTLDASALVTRTEFDAVKAELERRTKIIFYFDDEGFICWEPAEQSDA